jgi:hypothetical protein
MASMRAYGLLGMRTVRNGNKATSEKKRKKASGRSGMKMVRLPLKKTIRTVS